MNYQKNTHPQAPVFIGSANTAEVTQSSLDEAFGRLTLNFDQLDGVISVLERRLAGVTVEMPKPRPEEAVGAPDAPCSQITSRVRSSAFALQAQTARLAALIDSLDI